MYSRHELSEMPLARRNRSLEQLASKRFGIKYLLGMLLGGGFAMLVASGPAHASVQITIDKNNQQMSVAVNGVQRYTWPVSSGVPAHETPNGTFKAFRMEEDHYSKEWDDAPMPHSIFFTKIGHAIHGTDSVRRLGSPASHGCVRLSRENAATLYAVVEKEGVLNTTVTLTGSSQVALARNPRNTAVARGDTLGDPVQLAPRGYSAGTNAQADSQDTPDNTVNVYLDQYGRPVSAYRNTGNIANPNAGGRRVYQPRSQYNEADAYTQQYGNQPQPRSQFFYYNR